jgi:hypothetical protein
MFVKITNGQVEKYPYSLDEFRKANPNKSFPRDIPTETLEANGVFVIKETMHPIIDKKTHTYRWTVEFKDDAWTQVWSTSRLDQEVAEKNVRGHRDRLLSGSDWTQVADAPVDQAAWATYRQALRDLPQAEGWPDVELPSEPGAVILSGNAD